MSADGRGRVLPPPATQSDMYGAAIVEELERLNGNIVALVGLLAPIPVEASAEVELREPEAKLKKVMHRDVKRE